MPVRQREAPAHYPEPLQHPGTLAGSPQGLILPSAPAASPLGVSPCACPGISLLPPALLHLRLPHYRAPKPGVSPQKDYGRAHAVPWEAALAELITQ